MQLPYDYHDRRYRLHLGQAGTGSSCPWRTVFTDRTNARTQVFEIAPSDGVGLFPR